MKERLRFDPREKEELIHGRKQQRRYNRKTSDLRNIESDVNLLNQDKGSDEIRQEPLDDRLISDYKSEKSDRIRSNPSKSRMTSDYDSGKSEEVRSRPSENRIESDNKNPKSDKIRLQRAERLRSDADKSMLHEEKPSEIKHPEASSASKKPRLKEVSSQAEKLVENKSDVNKDSPVTEQLQTRQKHGIYEQPKAKKNRLRFDQKTSMPEQAIHGVGSAVSRSVAGETKADENVSVQAAERTAQESGRAVRNVRQRLKAGKDRTQKRSSAVRSSSRRQELLHRTGTEPPESRPAGQQQRSRIRRNYAEGYRLAQKAESGTVKGSAAPRPTLLNRIRNGIQSVPKKSKGGLAVLGALGIFAMIIVSALGAGGTMTSEAEGIVSATTYLAEDEEILAAEDRYLELERQLQNQIDDIEIDYPGYDEYVYQIDEIGHNPYYLISYLTVMFGEFRYSDVATPIQGLFEQQYTIRLEEETETVTETRTIRAGESLGNVVTSGYCPCELCCGKSDGITASGKKATANHTIAVDMNNPFVPMGTHVIMNGTEYVVEDVGAFDRYGVQFDVFYDDHQTATAHGHQTWEARLADDNGEEIEVTETREITRLLVKVTNRNLDVVIRGLLDDEEQLEEYLTYNSCYGNKEYLFGTENLPGEGGYAGIKYEIPPEALKDKQFKAMITEAEKYLGMAYKWGGKKPSEGFDCSGFVSWVINHCGVGWDFGSRGAEALCGLCTYVSPSEARPGDLVFFERTYDVDGVSHVGIYVGEHIMIHCGDPIQYTNLEYQYWKDHFLCFGRLPSP